MKLNEKIVQFQNKLKLSSERMEELQSKLKTSNEKQKELQSQIELHQQQILYLQDITPANEHEIVIDQRIPNEVIEIFKNYVEAINTNNVELMEATFSNDLKDESYFHLFSGFSKEDFSQNETQYTLLKLGQYRKINDHAIEIVVLFQEGTSMDIRGSYFYLHHLLEEEQWNWKIVNRD
ncbi:hypothetical protein [Longirhabdus pacifica]|uniref:hypothetical protein n=1 Tax=Longirhabdus pacifica TaxID=2305227 RepID=UPI001008FE4F|nr:hypothetical protein [Longirhabdus pacifica]